MRHSFIFSDNFFSETTKDFFDILHEDSTP